MRSKTPLVLMEQMIMLLIFALAAALCLQAFVKSDQLSQASEAKDRALQAAQNAAEVVRACGGDMERAASLLEAQHHDGASLQIDYDASWRLAEDTMRYTLGVALQTGSVPGLGQAQIWVRDESGEEELLRFDVAWQKEVSAHG